MTIRSVRLDRPIDPVITEILAAVAEAARAEGIAHMLVGATARDILLTHVLGLDAPRSTRDVDFAVAVEDWKQFDALRHRLLARGTFTAGQSGGQRLYYKRRHADLEYQLDLVPFGGVAREGNQVAWPPDMKTVMNVAGYEDVLKAAEDVAFTPGLVGKVVSLAGLAVMKLVAWSDRGKQNPKDAQDLIHLMRNYAGAGNHDRIYDEEGIIEAADYDPELAGVYLLGTDIRRLASAGTRQVLARILERDFSRLTREMIRPYRHLDNVEHLVVSGLGLLLRALTESRDDGDQGGE